MKLTEIIVPGAIVPSLAATRRDEVVAELVNALVAAGAIPMRLRDELVSAALEREKRGSTGFGKGVAVPHVKHSAPKKVALAIGLSPKGVDFNALDKQPVYTVFLLISPEGKPEEHLKAMELIFKNLSYETFRRFLRQADTEAKVMDLLQDADAQQGSG